MSAPCPAPAESFPRTAVPLKKGTLSSPIYQGRRAARVLHHTQRQASSRAPNPARALRRRHRSA